MKKQDLVTGVLVYEGGALSLVEICEICHISESTLIEWVEEGVLGHETPPRLPVTFDGEMIQRIHAAHRLQRDLGINLQGVVLALELLDELETLRSELSILKRAL